MVGLAGQQAVCPHGNGLFEQTPACSADDGQPPHGPPAVGVFHLHCRAGFGQVAAACPARPAPFSPVPALRMGSTSPTRPQPPAKGSPFRIPKMPVSTSFETALGGVQIGVRTDTAEMLVLHQLEGDVPGSSRLSGLKDDRMVGHDEPAAFGCSFLHHFRGDYQRDQHPGPPVCRSPPEGRGCPSFRPVPAARCAASLHKVR